MRLLDEYQWEDSRKRRRSNEVLSVEDLHYKRNRMGEQEELEKVSNTNLVDYIRRTLEYCLDKGIRAQMDAFKGGWKGQFYSCCQVFHSCVVRIIVLFVAGLERVLPMRWLSLFTSEEIGNLIRGESDVVWTREELLAYITPDMGYTKSSATFLYLVDVLMEFNAEERRKFVGFVSGSSCLPVGGWRNLQPRLKVVPKEANEGPYPSVSVCSHYLKLPKYSRANDLRQYLLAAMAQPGFHLN